MKELINIVNSKFQAVVDELKDQKNTLEAKLKRIIEDIDKKVIIASKYKEDVEKSNNIISDLEKKIDGLKKDLQDLHDKFESAGFKEIIEAGNKEINGKIIEHNTKISEEKENIKRYQDEVQNLKDELATLKDSKHNLERELSNTETALNYYSSRIDEITIYAIENSDKLDKYKSKEEVEKEIEEPTEEVESKDIDGSIFNEIDEISTGNKEISEEELNEILSNKYEEEETSEEDEEAELTKTQLLDDVISKTQEIINNASVDEDYLSLLDENKEEEATSETQEETTEEPVSEETTEELDEQPEDDVEEVVEEQPVEEEKVEEIPAEEEKVEEIPAEEEKVEEIPAEEENVVETTEEVLETTEEATEEKNEETPVNSVPELTAVDFDALDNKVEEKVETTDEDDEVKNIINKIGLKYDLFDSSIKKIKNIDYNNALRIVDCLDLHFIGVDNIYKNPQILITIKPDVLDKVLDLLEGLGCVASTFDYIFKYIDKIDVEKLEMVPSTKTDCIINILYDVIHNLDLKSISDVLGLTDEETKTLEANLDAREYNVMCGFTDVIKANYDTLNGYHIADINKCFTEHPKRFLLNPDVFDTILDKYDPQDLVRCINKNVAVLDRL